MVSRPYVQAKKELADQLSDIDVVIEMVDARLPMSLVQPDAGRADPAQAQPENPQ